MTTLDDNGHEVVSNKPIDLPMGFKKPETLAEQVRRLVRSEQWNQHLGETAETFQEADDFEVGDDFEPAAPYEMVFDPILQREISHDEFIRNSAEYKKLYLEAAKEEIPMPPEDPKPEEKPAVKTDEKSE